MKIEVKILNKEFYKNEYESSCHGDSPNCGISCLDTYENLPDYATSGSAALDLVATKDYVIYPGEVVPIHTGLAIWIGSYPYKPQLTCFKSLDSKDADRYHGCSEQVSVAAHIIPRSGRGAKEGLVIANTVGLIDEDYKSELIVYALNRNKTKRWDGYEEQTVEPIKVKAGERFAQMYFTPIIKPTFKIVEEFSDPTIVHYGFGSTGNG